MTRFWLGLVAIAVSQPVLAREQDAPYYGPMKRWHGIGYKTGYNDRVEKDGSWRIDAATHGGGDAIDMALYRAAERASEQGYRYLFLLGGRGSKAPGQDMATVYARPSHDLAPPIGCRSKKITSCYTADVREVMRILGGPGGTKPGVPIVDHLDEYGREVRFSGYGTGGVATLVPGGVARSQMTTITEYGSRARATPIAPAASVPAAHMLNQIEGSAAKVTNTAPYPMPTFQAPSPSAQASARQIAEERFKATRKSVSPIRGGDPKQGWTISD